jgi:hypothetical protein
LTVFFSHEGNFFSQGGQIKGFVEESAVFGQWVAIFGTEG